MESIRVLRPVDGGGAQGAKVWHAVLVTGEQIAVKQHSHAGAGEVEFGVLHMLHGLGAPVVRPLQWDAESQVLTTEWVGRHTLAATMHEPAARLSKQEFELPYLAQSLVRGCIGLETAFSGLANRLPRRTKGELQRRHSELHRRCRRATQTYVRFVEFFNLAATPAWETSLRTAWEIMEPPLSACRLTFGGRDCTPRNVLTDGSQVWFIDFAVVGLDWPEARLAQYAAFIGADAPDALPQSLLTHAEERWYVESGCIESAALDMHHLLLWSEAIRLLLDREQEHRGATRARDEHRLEQALAIVLTPLTGNSPAATVRSLIADVCATL